MNILKMIPGRKQDKVTKEYKVLVFILDVKKNKFRKFITKVGEGVVRIASSDLKVRIIKYRTVN